MLRQSDNSIALRLAAVVSEVASLDAFVALARARGHDVGALRERREMLRKLRWRLGAVEHHREYGKVYGRRYRRRRQRSGR